MKTLVLGAAMLVSTFAVAEDSAQPNIDYCTDTACHADEFKRADSDLNASYLKLIGRLHKHNESAVQLLRQSQRAWLVYREKYCAFEGKGIEDGSGSARAIVGFGCLTAITRTRTAELDFQLNCPEGDLACV